MCGIYLVKSRTISLPSSAQGSTPRQTHTGATPACTGVRGRILVRGVGGASELWGFPRVAPLASDAHARSTCCSVGVEIDGTERSKGHLAVFGAEESEGRVGGAPPCEVIEGCGAALAVVLLDAVVRWQRMNGPAA